MRNSNPESIPFLFEADQCFETYRKVHFYKKLWDKRDMAPWFTFGPAIYLEKDFDKYMDKCWIFKDTLDEDFAPEKEIILNALKVLVGDKVKFHPTYMPFGFHIFFAHPIFLEDNLGSIHMDKQEELLKWDGEVEEKLSLTVAVCLPKSGGGLNYWVGEEKKYYEYSWGEGIYHFGNLKHQISSAKPPIDKFDERITLQCHVVKVNDVWQIHR